MKAPAVRFTTKMFHPNVSADGRISLWSSWSPLCDVSAILTSIQSLLYEPNTEPIDAIF